MGNLDQYKKKSESSAGDVNNPYTDQEAYMTKQEPTPELAGAFKPQSNSVNSVDTSQTSKGIDMGQVGTATAGGAAAGGPWGAAIAAAGSLASQYLGQKAADERAKRERGAAIEKAYGDDQQQAINSIMANQRSALR